MKRTFTIIGKSLWLWPLVPMAFIKDEGFSNREEYFFVVGFILFGWLVIPCVALIAEFYEGEEQFIEHAEDEILSILRE